VVHAGAGCFCAVAREKEEKSGSVAKCNVSTRIEMESMAGGYTYIYEHSMSNKAGSRSDAILLIDDLFRIMYMK
jgi:hypothetical protein